VRGTNIVQVVKSASAPPNAAGEKFAQGTEKPFVRFAATVYNQPYGWILIGPVMGHPS